MRQFRKEASKENKKEWAKEEKKAGENSISKLREQRPTKDTDTGIQNSESLKVLNGRYFEILTFFL